MVFGEGPLAYMAHGTKGLLSAVVNFAAIFGRISIGPLNSHSMCILRGLSH